MNPLKVVLLVGKDKIIIMNCDRYRVIPQMQICITPLKIPGFNDIFLSNLDNISLPPLLPPPLALKVHVRAYRVRFNNNMCWISKLKALIGYL